MTLSHSQRTLFAVSSVVFTTVTFSCTEETVDVSSQLSDLNYFPLSTGTWVEYEADSIVHYNNDDVYNVDTSIGTFHFFIREEVDTPFIDGEGEEAYVIRRYKRENDSFPWALTNVWTAKVNNWSAQKVEDNVRFIRLKFPIDETATWSGNAYNFFTEEEYAYENVYEPKQFGNLNFDSTVTVLQHDFTSQINRIYKKEIYGANTGLLFKVLDSVNTRYTTGGMIILNGLEYKLNIIAYQH